MEGGPRNKSPREPQSLMLINYELFGNNAVSEVVSEQYWLAGISEAVAVDTLARRNTRRDVTQGGKWSLRTGERPK